MNPRLSLVVTALSSTLAAVACAGYSAPAVAPTREVAGTCQPAFGAQVCSWAQMSGSKVLAVGATVPMAAIDNTPVDAPMVWPPVVDAVVPMPAEARSATGIDHLALYWEHHGHPPKPFLTPHFDFHFYTISDADRRAIDCSSKAKPAVLPPGYSLPDVEIPGIGMLTGLCVSAMGMHSLVTTDLEATTPFSGTMVLGFYDTRPIFFEPMIAKAKLEEKQSFTVPMVMPAGLAAGVHYPTKFEAVYDATIPGYRLVFSGFGT
jgi:hypothetical protein